MTVSRASEVVLSSLATAYGSTVKMCHDARLLTPQSADGPGSSFGLAILGSRQTVGSASMIRMLGLLRSLVELKRLCWKLLAALLSGVYELLSRSLQREYFRDI